MKNKPTLQPDISNQLFEGQKLLDQIALIDNQEKLNQINSIFIDWSKKISDLLLKNFQEAGLHKKIDSFYYADILLFTPSNHIKFAMKAREYITQLDSEFNNLNQLINDKTNKNTLERWDEKLKNAKPIAFILLLVPAILGAKELYDLTKDLIKDFSKDEKEIARNKLLTEMGLTALIEKKDSTTYKIKDSDLKKMIGENVEIRKEEDHNAFYLNLSIPQDIVDSSQAIVLQFNPNFYNRLGGNKNGPDGWKNFILPDDMGRCYRSKSFGVNLSLYVSQIK